MEQNTSYSEDECYVIKAQHGDQDALSFLMKKYHNLAHYIALKICHCDADAEDIVQESFIEVERSIGNLNEPKYFKAWLNKIIFSKSTKLFRRNKDIIMSDQDTISLTQSKEKRRYLLPKEESNFQNDRELLLHLIDGLPEKLRTTLYLMYFEELSVKEISMILDIPEGTVKSRVSSAKLQLREKIEAYENKERVKLDFHATSLEVAIAGAIANEFTAFHAPAVVSHTLAMGRNIIKAVPPTALAMMTLVVVSVGSLSYAGYQAYVAYQDARQQPIQPNSLAVSANSYHEFPSITFQGETITTAEQAHEVITTTAHCQEEILELDKDTQEEIKKVYLALKSNGGAYYELLFHRGYAEIFE